MGLLEVFLQKTEEQMNEMLLKIHENDSSSIEDAERIHTLEVEVVLWILNLVIYPPLFHPFMLTLT